MNTDQSAMALLLAAGLATMKGTPGAVSRCQARTLRAAEHVRLAGLSIQAGKRPRETADRAMILMARGCRICGKCPGVTAPGKSA